MQQHWFPLSDVSDVNQLASTHKLSCLLSQGLLRRYRLTISHLEKQLSDHQNVDEAFTSQLKHTIEGLKSENASLLEENEKIVVELEETRKKFSEAVAVHTEVSSQAVFSESEKLKVIQMISLLEHINGFNSYLPWMQIDN